MGAAQAPARGPMARAGVLVQLEHDPEKWNRFSEKIMLKQKARHDPDST
jgi:hypothetical protein